MVPRTDNLASFVPSALFKRTLGSDANSPFATHFKGSVLFADISGFTRLVERLCQQGLEGVERLRAVLDRAFSGYVNCVYEFGGEVACFAGDALIAYWASDQDSLEVTTRRAAGCAQALQSLVINDPSGSEANPDLHIGVGAGNLWGARLGGVDGRWKLLLAGSAVRESAWAEARARERETLFGPTAAPLVERREETCGPMPLAGVQPPSSGGTNDLFTQDHSVNFDMAGLVPRVVQTRYATTEQTWASEFRRICVLFVRIEGLDEEANDALARHQEAVRKLLEALRPHCGSTGTLLLDDKGLIFKLTLGVPLDSHPDDAARAVRAGFAIGQAMESQGLKWSAGVAAGHGFCGAIGGAKRREYVATGLPLPVAARLMEAAGGGLLCTQEVATQVKDTIDLSYHGSLQLRGVERLVEAHRAVGCSATSWSGERLLGRARERQLLLTCLNKLTRGESSVVWISGEAGVGKSALVRDFLKSVHQKGIFAVAGGTESGEYAISYVAWRGVFTGLLEVGHDEKPHTLFERINELWLARIRRRERSPLLSAVLPIEIEETEFSRSLKGQVRVRATLTLLVEILRLTAKRRPVVIVLEDCQWMDSASWRLAELAAKQVPRLLLVMTSRSAPGRPELVSIRQLASFTELDLGPLGKDAINELVHDLFEGQAVNAEIMAEIEHRAQGNPFFAREYTWLLKTNGAVSLVNRCWELNAQYNTQSEHVPTTIESLITSRVDNLTPDEVTVLKTASVIGDSFVLPVLEASCPVESSQNHLRSVVQRLERHQLIVSENQAERTFAFCHQLIREVVYNLLPYIHRRALHRSVATSLEMIHTHNLSLQYDVLAHHWAMAGVPEPTVKYADLAAYRALRTGAYSEAESLLERCVRLVEEQKQVPAERIQLVRWHRQLGDARHGLGNQEGRAQEARRALALGGRRRPDSTAGLVTQSVWRLLCLQTRRLMKSAYKIPKMEEQELIQELTRSYRHSAYAGYFLNDPLGTMYDSINAVECAERITPSADLAGAYSELGGYLGVAGLRNTGWRLLGRAVRVAEQVGEPDGLAYVHMVNCLYAVGMGNWDTAEMSAKLCQEYSEKLGDRVNWANAQIVLFWTNYYQGQQGQLEFASEIANKLLAQAREAGNRQQEVWGLRAVALCDLRRHAASEASQRLEQCLHYQRGTESLIERLETQGPLALAHLCIGETQKALTLAADALKLARQSKRPVNHSMLESYSTIAEVIFDAWSREPDSAGFPREARACVEGLRRYRRFFPIGEPRYRLWRGRYELLRGRSRKAIFNWRRGLRHATRLGMKWDESYLRGELERVSSAGPRLRKDT